jgi:flagellar hook assembly protein FlgD
MAYEYKWAANQMKLARAIAAVKDRVKAGEKIEDEEAAVKAQYVKYLGQVLELDEVVERGDGEENGEAEAKAAKEAAKAEAKAAKEAAKAAKNDK